MIHYGYFVGLPSWAKYQGYFYCSWSPRYTYYFTQTT